MSIVRITGRATMRGSLAPSPGRDRGSGVVLLPHLGLKVQDDNFDLGAPHGGTVDSRGDIYVGEVSWTVYSSYLHPGEPVPPTVRSLQKLVRV